MASTCKTQTVVCSETREEDKQGSSSTLEECPVVNRPSDEFPEGGLEAWATAFGA